MRTSSRGTNSRLVARRAGLVVVLFAASGCTNAGLTDGGATADAADAADLADARPTDARPADAEAPDTQAPDTSDGATSDAMGAGDAVVGLACQLLGTTCGSEQACYPYPFEAVNPKQARCARQGTTAMGTECQSQLDCDGDSLCVAPGQLDAVCRVRCAVANPECPTGQVCVPLISYKGVGACFDDTTRRGDRTSP